MVREIVDTILPPHRAVRIQASALQALQEAAEAALVSEFHRMCAFY